MSVHNFQIYEVRETRRVQHYSLRTIKTESLARLKVIELARDRRFRHLTRNFELWDGTLSKTKITILRGKILSERAYLLPEKKYNLDKDYELYKKPSLRNAKVGITTGDLTSFIAKGVIDKVICTIGNKSEWTENQKVTSRRLEK